MSEFYGDRETAPTTAPEDDPVLTVRMAPPNTQARRLDLNVLRVVKTRPRIWTVVCPVDSVVTSSHFTDADVADWPVVHPVTIGAAQRLAAGRTTGTTGQAPALPSDPDERLFR